MGFFYLWGIPGQEADRSIVLPPGIAECRFFAGHTGLAGSVPREIVKISVQIGMVTLDFTSSAINQPAGALAAS
jgi:hypothetical protein